MYAAFNLIILEDDADERQLLSLLIKRNFPCWNLHMTATLEQLLETLQKAAHLPQRTSLLLVDMYLQDSDGLTVLQKVRQLDGFASLPVIGFSNYSSKVNITAFMEAGAAAFFAKLNEIDQLVGWLAGLPSFAVGK